MREVSRDERGHRGRQRRRRPRREAEHETRGLRLVEGGRRAGANKDAVSAPAKRPRRRDIPAVVKRRRRVAALVMLLVAAGLVTYVLLGPVTRMIDSRRNLAQAEAQLAEEKSRTQVLEDRKDQALTEEYVEWEARKMGYVKPGEIPVIVLDDKDQEEPPAENIPETSNP